MQADVDNDGASAELSMHECVDGLNRAEAARVFYQLLGTSPCCSHCSSQGVPALLELRVNHLHSST
jgi:hypothetical protein